MEEPAQSRPAEPGRGTPRSLSLLSTGIQEAAWWVAGEVVLISWGPESE